MLLCRIEIVLSILSSTTDDESYDDDDEVEETMSPSPKRQIKRSEISFVV